MIMLLEQDQMMRSCRLHLTVAFGLLEPLLRLSILFRPQLNIPWYAYGGGDRYRPGVQYVYAVPLNDLSRYIYNMKWDFWQDYSIWFSNSSNNGEETPRWSVARFVSCVPYNAVTDGRHQAARQTQTKKHQSDRDIYFLHNICSDLNCLILLYNSGT